MAKRASPEISSNGSASHREEPFYDPILVNQMKRFIANEMARSRTELRNLIFDDRRDIENECGHPAYGSLVDVWQLRMLYDRLPEAGKVVELQPKWTWSQAPEVREDEDPDSDTTFEGAFKEFAKSITPEPSKLKTTEDSSAIWTELRRLDICSRIGGYGVMVLGYDDGAPLHEPLFEVTDFPMTPEEEDALRSPQPLTFPSIFGGTNVTLKMERNALTTNRCGPWPSEQEVVEQWVKERELVINKVNAGENPKKGPKGGKPKKLLWTQCFSEELAQIIRWDWNLMSPRFNMPIMYRITMNDPRGGYSGIGLPFTTVFVHWSRIIHVFDKNESFGAARFAAPPAMRPVLNELLNIRKVRGASGEGLWKAAFTKLFLETHPQMGGDVRVPEAKIQRMMENMYNSQQPWGWFAGMHVNPVAPQVSDPTPHIAVNVAAICAKLDIPKRIWEGSERGELSSAQDSGSWEGRMSSRQQFYAGPCIAGPFINRQIQVGLLPEPESGEWDLRWPDIAKVSDDDKAKVGLTRSQAIAQYVTSGAEQLIPPVAFLSKILGLSDNDAQSMIDEATEQAEEDMLTVAPEPEPEPFDGAPAPDDGTTLDGDSEAVAEGE